MPRGNHNADYHQRGSVVVWSLAMRDSLGGQAANLQRQLAWERGEDAARRLVP